MNRTNKSQGGLSHVQDGVHSRPSKGRIRGERKTIGVAGITAGQGNGLANDMVEGRARASRRIRQTAEQCGW